MSDAAARQSYLKPYLSAARRHGSSFDSLLWASPATQALRFEALGRLCDFSNLNILDAGCGRADFLDFLIGRKTPPAHYVGIEAIEELAAAARKKRHPRSVLIHADFVRDPARMLVGADAIIFCGSLNTLKPRDFFTTLSFAFSATADWLVFNFLCTDRLAQADWLTWHDAKTVHEFASKLTPHISVLNDYLDGDCTIALRKEA